MDDELIKKVSQYTGRLGGQKTKEKYGSAHFSNAGKKGMESRWGKKRSIKRKKSV